MKYYRRALTFYRVDQNVVERLIPTFKWGWIPSKRTQVILDKWVFNGIAKVVTENEVFLERI